MAAVDIFASDFEGEHIGPAPSTIRNGLFALAIVAMAGLLAFFYWPREGQYAPAAAELDQFRSAMWNKCGGEDFAGPTNPKLVEIYAGSSKMRSVVVDQFHKLQRDNTACSDVIKALRTVDYPVR